MTNIELKREHLKALKERIVTLLQQQIDERQMKRSELYEQGIELIRQRKELEGE